MLTHDLLAQRRGTAPRRGLDFRSLAGLPTFDTMVSIVSLSSLNPTSLAGPAWNKSEIIAQSCAGACGTGRSLSSTPQSDAGANDSSTGCQAVHVTQACGRVVSYMVHTEFHATSDIVLGMSY